MRIDIITLFPKMFSGPFDESIVKRAVDKKLVEIHITNLRDFAIDKRGTVDDKPYGGGVGMVLRPEPIFEAVTNIKKTMKQLSGRTILLSASGKQYNQKKALEFSKIDQLILICGHYEGVDQRVVDHLANEEISIGDYVLTGGEIPAMVIVDSVIRLLPGVLTKSDATKHESFSPSLEIPTAKLLVEYPQYTRPQEFHGFKVPEVLLSGHHKDIEKWRQDQALKKTRKIRPDLIA